MVFEEVEYRDEVELPREGASQSLLFSLISFANRFIYNNSVISKFGTALHLVCLANR